MFRHGRWFDRSKRVAMKKPNFFVLGAPKCGTTTICSWLAAHEQVFFSPQKEPNFFNTDSKHRGTFRLDRYEQYFEGAEAKHKAVGEGSVWYLASLEAVKNILEYSPDARFIVCVRNPVEAAVSLHNQAVYSAHETIRDFREAWEAQWRRQSGEEEIPATCLELAHLLYGESCLYGKQIARLLDTVSADRVLFITLDEIKLDPRSVYLQTLAHLGVEDDGKTVFEWKNAARSRRFPRLANLVQYITVAKARHEVHWGTGLGAIINRLNTRERSAPPIDLGMRQELRGYFSADICLCAKLIGKDLSRWYKE